MVGGRRGRSRLCFRDVEKLDVDVNETHGSRRAIRRQRIARIESPFVRVSQLIPDDGLVPNLIAIENIGDERLLPVRKIVTDDQMKGPGVNVAALCIDRPTLRINADVRLVTAAAEEVIVKIEVSIRARRECLQVAVVERQAATIRQRNSGAGARLRFARRGGRPSVTNTVPIGNVPVLNRRAHGVFFRRRQREIETADEKVILFRWRQAVQIAGGQRRRLLRRQNIVEKVTVGIAALHRLPAVRDAALLRWPVVAAPRELRCREEGAGRDGLVGLALHAENRRCVGGIPCFLSRRCVVRGRRRTGA